MPPGRRTTPIPKPRERFDARCIPVAGVRLVRVWGLQLDDERELPGHERTRIPDEEIWEINLEAADGSHFQVASTLLTLAETWQPELRLSGLSGAG